MNTDRVLAELPLDMQTWMQTHATPDHWEATARAVATSVGHQLLSWYGEAGNTRTLHASLLEHESAAVRAIAAALGCGARRWSMHQVTKGLQAYFELASAYKALSQRMSSASVGELPTAKVA